MCTVPCQIEQLITNGDGGTKSLSGGGVSAPAVSGGLSSSAGCARRCGRDLLAGGSASVASSSVTTDGCATHALDHVIITVLASDRSLFCSATIARLQGVTVQDDGTCNISCTHGSLQTV